MTFLNRQGAWYGTVLLSVGTIVAAVGCNTAGSEKLALVAGKVTVDGQPLKTGSVTFKPDASRGNSSQHHPTSAIDADGHYELSVPPERKGAPPGWYQIVVTAYDNPRPGRLKTLIDVKYQDEKTTPLKIEVIENPEPGRYDLKLMR